MFTSWGGLLCLYGHDIDTNYYASRRLLLIWAIQKYVVWMVSVLVVFWCLISYCRNLRINQPGAVLLFGDGRCASSRRFDIVWCACKLFKVVTSGGFSSTLAQPIVRLYVSTSSLGADQPLFASVRGLRVFRDANADAFRASTLLIAG